MVSEAQRSTDSLRRRLPLLCFLIGSGLLIARPMEAAPPPPSAAKPVRFSRDIRPILSRSCFACHGPDGGKRAASLRLDTREGVLRAFAAGNAAKSPAFQRMTAKNPARRMPPPDSNHPLTQTQIAVIRRWIAQGAPWEQHWAFVAPVRPPLPAVRQKNWPKNPVDSFVLARLEQANLTPSPPAAKGTLLRRVTLDLTGLPPTPKELDAFLADRSPNAYEKVVDRLLASPRYGERMVWEWLDAARYADTNGFQEDRTRTMWPWRDWVIDALNRNMPFDRFTIEQIAGDLLPGAGMSQKIATGFNRNHMLNGEGGRLAEESRVDYVVDRVETTATTWLGLTVGCARCHDHKFDPVSQKEFFRLFAYFNNIAESGGVDRGGNANPVLPLPTGEQRARVAALEASLAVLDKQIKEKEDALRPAQPEWEQEQAGVIAGDAAAKIPANITALLKIERSVRTTQQTKDLTAFYLAQNPAYAALQKERGDTRKSLDAVNGAILMPMVMEERPAGTPPRDTFVLILGAYDRPGEKVTSGVPSVLPPLLPGAPANRLGLARWLVGPRNPLTARVAVNRIWQTVFGTGIVRTAEDFGVQGEPPTHPELLDWLATEFARKRWDMKALIRLLVTSAAYRQSSRVTPALLARDPENRLLARAPRYRLPSFLLRDQALALGGLLVEKVGGPPVNPYQPEGVWEDFSYGKIVYRQDHGENLYRRSLYTFWRRSVAPTTLFDAAARRVCTVRQGRTNTPLQALTLLNDVTFVEAARAFAGRAMKQGGTAPETRIAWAFRAAVSRWPTAKEKAVLMRGFARSRAHYASDPDAAKKLLAVGESKPDAALDTTELAAYTGVAAVLLNLDETLSKE